MLWFSLSIRHFSVLECWYLCPCIEPFASSHRHDLHTTALWPYFPQYLHNPLNCCWKLTLRPLSVSLLYYSLSMMHAYLWQNFCCRSSSINLSGSSSSFISLISKLSTIGSYCSSRLFIIWIIKLWSVMWMQCRCCPIVLAWLLTQWSPHQDLGSHLLGVCW